MSMAITKRLLANVILLLCLAMASFEAKGMRGAIIRPGPRAGRRRDPSEKIYNVVHFGAKTDPRKDNALAFIQAWNAACNWRGKARLLVPRGIFVASSMVFGGPCKNTAPTVFQLVGTLKAVSDLSSYAEDFWMIFQNVNGLVVTGTGTVDGQGPNVWKYNNHEGSVFPTSIKFYRVANGIIRRINSVNPMGFHIGIVLSQNIRARNLHLIAPEDSPNTDGIHISQSNQVKVARSVIATGDDCVGMIHGSTDISIKKMTCGPGHGISIGSLGKYPDEKDVKSILVRNCTLRNTENGIRIKTWAGSPPSQATALTFQDIIMHDVKNPIIIDQSYGSKSKAPSKVQISDVKYMNIRGTTTSKVGVDIECSKQFPCQRVHLANINLKYTGAKKHTFSATCQNARVSYAGMQFPPPCR
ncbi:exopolygalacturonase clone GBGE184-like [Hevea brasiliensis]|uniref:exopolygalacturonase clone GBGE184-like n=1 Tax=Hevea brasiliensis TaxID=3981 RepID=UPI0025EDCE8D|nr:exopolygalacturonase clone GBGE184-like [Hevea brasiliensis]